MTQLKRNISLPLLIFYGLGTILGAGIYVLIGKVAAFSGEYTPFAFLFSAFVAGLTGFSYAELSSRFPKSGGEANYVLEAFNSHRIAAVMGWLIVLTGIVSAATIVRGVSGYLDYFIQLPPWQVILITIAGLTALAIWGIKESVLAATVVALLEISGLLIVIVVARPSLSSIVSYSHTILPPMDVHFWPGIFAGSFIAFYAFIGFEDMVNIAEEVIEPKKNLPRGIIVALVTSTVLYLLVSFVAISSMPIAQLAKSRAPMAELFTQHGGSGQIMALISLVAVINGALVQIIMASRVIYGMGSQGSISEWFAYISPKTQTPIVATLLVSAAIVIFSLMLPIVQLAQVTSFLILIIFSFINVALMVVKRRVITNGGAIRVPILVPALGCLSCTALIVVQFF